MISSSASRSTRVPAWLPRAFPAALFRLFGRTLGAAEARRGRRGEAGIFPGHVCPGDTRQPPPPRGSLSRVRRPEPRQAFPPPGTPRWAAPPPADRGITPAVPVPCPPLRGGRGGPGGTRRLLGLVVRAAAAASRPARPGTTLPTWPCAPAHERSGAVAHLLYCLAEDKKKSNWRDCKANVAGAAGAK